MGFLSILITYNPFIGHNMVACRKSPKRGRLKVVLCRGNSYEWTIERICCKIVLTNAPTISICMFYIGNRPCYNIFGRQSSSQETSVEFFDENRRGEFRPLNK